LLQASGSTVDSAFLESDVMDGLVFAGSNALYTSEDLPGVQAFNKLIDEKLPEVRDSDQFSLPLIFSTAGAELFAAAAESAKLTPTSKPADLYEGLYALKDETLGGVSPPLNFVKGMPGATLCYFPQRIEGGKFVSDAVSCPDAATAKAIGAALGAG
jgi:branched-chain amino acid transport system substrate-binding protein